MKLREIPVTIAMMPKPDPPVVTISPEVFLSLAKPLTGCAKSQKYLKVWRCTSVSNSSSGMRGNLSEESSRVNKFTVTGAVNAPSCLERRDIETFTVNFERNGNGEDGVITITLSLFDNVWLKGTAVPAWLLNVTALAIEALFTGAEKLMRIVGEVDK